MPEMNVPKGFLKEFAAFTTTLRQTQGNAFGTVSTEMKHTQMTPPVYASGGVFEKGVLWVIA